MRLSKLGFLLLLATGFVAAGCGSRNDGREEGRLGGEVRIDGSSTVYPITEAIAEEFRIDQPDVKITVGVSGTGGGFNKFSRGETDINNASRPVKAQEAEDCKKNNIDFIELKVAFDGLVVVVNKENKWLNEISVEELKKIWEPAAQEKITRWKQVNPEWPDAEFHLYGPGIASGTYDYFTEAVVGKSGSSRGDYTASEDDNVLVQGIAGDKNGLGFFGLAYYEENKDKLKLVGVNNGGSVVFPSSETVKNGTYAPLSRPVFIYVSDVSAKRPEVVAFVRFYLENASLLVPDVGYIPLTDQEYAEGISKLDALTGLNHQPDSIR
ncbi:MAG: PstS family phosphate ABC transporter substrate-binding protein [Bacteroidota bacterium]|nr:PstS family phosphate ABC transporter substrate-binding protein [Bacteroidota bacterium]